MRLPFTWIFISVSTFHWPRISLGQYPRAADPDFNVTTIRSPIDEDIIVRFTSPPPGTCTTVFPAQKQYTGYVTLPPFKLAPIQQDYSVNTFFWFIEARTNPSSAPLTIFLNGGPGSSSMVGLFQEVGPCEAIEIAQGRFGTQPRDWGWDRSSNILFIDQPNQVGFSFDKKVNGSLNLLTSVISSSSSGEPADQPAYTLLEGTFASNDARFSANTTEIAAHTVWHMLQAFLVCFPQYNPGAKWNSTQSGVVGVNLFTESYGGKYGPLFAAHFESQNLLRRSGRVPKNDTLEIHLTSLGIMQGCIDDLVQGKYYPIFANNNTYGIKALSLVDQQNAANNYVNADGCQQQIQTCRGAVASADKNNQGDVEAVNQICRSAEDYSELQKAIGVSTNYTESNGAVAKAFQQTGDYERGNQIAQMAYLLSLGVRVALIYGDRDYVCNWLGGEAVSFSIAAQSSAYDPFYTAGYADIVVNQTYVGGTVRQYGNLSFSRIYDAGHLIPAYQPETVFTVFTRVILGTGLSLGEPVDLRIFKSSGDANASHTNEAPDPVEPICWVRNIANTCSADQKEAIKNGEGYVINGVLYDQPSDWNPPASSVSVEAGYPGTISPAMTASPSQPNEAPSKIGGIPTGVYVASATPSTSKNAESSTNICFRLNLSLWIGMFLAVSSIERIN
ncbi:MAG: hypothetical protein LQ342_003278 [Letrouitia transgressa]|nr:MAG: hypothetical protein LQ342_003278 [Letrouitia transgressa]